MSELGCRSPPRHCHAPFSVPTDKHSSYRTQMASLELPAHLSTCEGLTEQCRELRDAMHNSTVSMLDKVEALLAALLQHSRVLQFDTVPNLASDSSSSNPRAHQDDLRSLSASPSRRKKRLHLCTVHDLASESSSSSARTQQDDLRSLSASPSRRKRPPRARSSLLDTGSQSTCEAARIGTGHSDPGATRRSPRPDDETTEDREGKESVETGGSAAPSPQPSLPGQLAPSSPKIRRQRVETTDSGGWELTPSLSLGGAAKVANSPAESTTAACVTPGGRVLENCLEASQRLSGSFVSVTSSGMSSDTVCRFKTASMRRASGEGSFQTSLNMDLCKEDEERLTHAAGPVEESVDSSDEEDTTTLASAKPLQRTSRSSISSNSSSCGVSLYDLGAMHTDQLFHASGLSPSGRAAACTRPVCGRDTWRSVVNGIRFANYVKNISRRCRLRPCGGTMEHPTAHEATSAENPRESQESVPGSVVEVIPSNISNVSLNRIVFSTATESQGTRSTHSLRDKNAPIDTLSEASRSSFALSPSQVGSASSRRHSSLSSGRLLERKPSFLGNPTASTGMETLRVENEIELMKMVSAKTKATKTWSCLMRTSKMIPTARSISRPICLRSSYRGWSCS